MRKHALVGSLAFHASALLLLLVLGTVAHQSKRVPPAVILFEPLHAPRLPAFNGGGGQNSPLPARRGRAPQPVKSRVFLPPMVAVNDRPQLVVQQALLESPEINLAMVEIGDPLGIGKLPSGGLGGPTGIGDHGRGGVGDGDGPRVGGSPGASLARITRHPVLLHKEEPEYSEDARKARFQGTVTLLIDVGLDGRPTNIRVTQGVGLGLDERAVDAVTHWRFSPAVAGDRPVVAPALIEVGFHLL
ncbi:MAG: TonB family protein [Bryobacterales bacterium]|nr:TonB family protein [Bryobacterales bacterium]